MYLIINNNKKRTLSKKSQTWVATASYSLMLLIVLWMSSYVLHFVWLAGKIESIILLNSCEKITFGHNFVQSVMRTTGPFHYNLSATLAKRAIFSRDISRFVKISWSLLQKYLKIMLLITQSFFWIINNSFTVILA